MYQLLIFYRARLAIGFHNNLREGRFVGILKWKPPTTVIQLVSTDTF